jgi:arsenic resistance protein ArsH
VVFKIRSFSRLTAFEAARILIKLGADVRVYNPSGLPLKDDTSDKHEKVQELRALSEWSDAHVWSCPEQHGAITGVFKTQGTYLSRFRFASAAHSKFLLSSVVDWIPLSVGSVRPTQGRTLAVIQVNGGSQSFNVVNTLRLLGRWMRMFTVSSNIG